MGQFKICGLVCCFTDDVNEVLGGYNDGFVRAFDL